MKNNFKFINQMLRILAILFVFVSCHKGKQDDGEKINHDMQHSSPAYYCPMHPEVMSDKPGICPKCGMDLELMPQKNNDTLSTLIQPTNRLVLSTLKAIAPSTENHAGRVGVSGYITYNPDNVNTISARISGRVEKMYIKYNFEKVTKGQKLLDLYSPELLTVQNEYLYILQTNEASDELSKISIRSKMINLGMNESEISNLEKTKKVSTTVPVYATANGHIHFVSENTFMDAHALSLPGTGNAATMNSKNTAATELIREGDYIKKGDAIFTIADESSVWALFKVMPSDIGSIQTGDDVDVIIDKNTYSGKVDFIEKYFNHTENFYTLRVYMQCNDHNQLKIGTLIRGYISIKNSRDKNLWIPTASIIQLGKGYSAVFIKKQLGYEAHKIQTGKQAFEWIEVLSGLNVTDSIAPVASYLVDSEAFISTDNN